MEKAIWIKKHLEQYYVKNSKKLKIRFATAQLNTEES
jgi:hypothetical protein